MIGSRNIFGIIDFDGNFWERVSQKIELRRTKRNENKIRDFNFSQDILEKHEPKNEKWNATLNFGKPKWISTLKGETKMLRKRDAELTKRVFKFYENHYVSNSQNKTLQNSKTFFVKRVLKHFRQNLLTKNTSRANHWNTSSKTHAFPQKQIQKQRKFYFSIFAKKFKNPKIYFDKMLNTNSKTQRNTTFSSAFEAKTIELRAKECLNFLWKKKLRKKIGISCRCP